MTSSNAPKSAVTDVQPSAAGSRLFLQYVLPDDSHEGISRQVWSGTPWITDAFTDSHSSDGGVRRRDMWEWCEGHYGPSAWPFSDNPRPGRWREGNATVFGWTWWGFSTEAEMIAFQEAFPDPPASPSRRLEAATTVQPIGDEQS